MKQHSKYSLSAKNNGKDMIYQSRIRLAKKLGIHIINTPRVYSYLINAHLNILLT